MHGLMETDQFADIVEAVWMLSPGATANDGGTRARRQEALLQNIEVVPDGDRLVVMISIFYQSVS